MKKMLSKIGLTVSLIPLFLYFAEIVFELPIVLGLISVVLASYASYVWKKLFDESLLFGISNELFEGARRTSISVGFISSVVVLMFLYQTDSELFDDRYILVFPGIISLSFIIFSSLVCILFWSWEGFSLKRIKKPEMIAPEMIAPETIPALKEQNNALPSFKLNKSGLLEAKGNDGWTIFYRLLAAAFGVTVLSSVIGYFAKNEDNSMSNRELLNKIVMQAKARTPMSVAPHTTLFDVTTDGVSLIYKYKFSDMDSKDWTKIDAAKINQQLKETYSNVYCSDKTHFNYLKRKITIRVVFADANEQPFNVINLNHFDCLESFMPLDSIAR